MYIFVYGTLRRRGGLNFKLADAAKFIGEFRTLPKYTLYDMGCPCLSPDGETSVLGEVYKVEDLAQIAHIHNMEVRAGYTLGEVELFNFNEPVSAYLQKPEGWHVQEIPGGDWIAYTRNDLYVDY